MAWSDMNAIDREEEAQAGRTVLSGLDILLVEFDEYSLWVEKAHDCKLNEQAVDVQKRIRQVRLVVSLLDAALAESRAIYQTADEAAKAADDTDNPMTALNAFGEALRPNLQRHSDLMSLIELHSETFYWVAARAMKAATYLPGMKTFAAPGVRDVRNHLIEHTEGKSSRVFNGGFAYGKPRGPVLAAMRTSETPDVWHDAGLFVNAGEFTAKFIASLRGARGAY